MALLNPKEKQEGPSNIIVLGEEEDVPFVVAWDLSPAIPIEHLSAIAMSLWLATPSPDATLGNWAFFGRQRGLERRL